MVKNFIIYSDGRVFIDSGWDEIHAGIDVSGIYKVMQSTGINDHKGVEIYEGDILLAYDKYWKVVFSQGCFIAWGPGRCKALRSMYCEVIGNVYQNPKIMVTR